jgi:hypothetical protein
MIKPVIDRLHSRLSRSSSSASKITHGTIQERDLEIASLSLSRGIDFEFWVIYYAC